MLQLEPGSIAGAEQERRARGRSPKWVSLSQLPQVTHPLQSCAQGAVAVKVDAGSHVSTESSRQPGTVVPQVSFFKTGSIWFGVGILESKGTALLPDPASSHLRQAQDGAGFRQRQPSRDDQFPGRVAATGLPAQTPLCKSPSGLPGLQSPLLHQALPPRDGAGKQDKRGCK